MKMIRCAAVLCLSVRCDTRFFQEGSQPEPIRIAASLAPHDFVYLDSFHYQLLKTNSLWKLKWVWKKTSVKYELDWGKIAA